MVMLWSEKCFGGAVEFASASVLVGNAIGEPLCRMGIGAR